MWLLRVVTLGVDGLLGASVGARRCVGGGFCVGGRGETMRR